MFLKRKERMREKEDRIYENKEDGEWFTVRDLCV